MKVSLKFDSNMRIIGSDEKGRETYFDTTPGGGGLDTAPTPMEVMLQAMGACSFMDVVAILRKKKRTITEFIISIDGVKAETHPKVFTDAKLIYELTSPDAEIEELEQAAKLSQEKYCAASAMFQRSGCKVTYECVLKR